MIKDAEFYSVWAGWDEDIVVSSKCKVNMDTKEVFDIELIEVDEDVDDLLEEYIRFKDDPKEYAVSGDQGEYEFWYD